MTIAAAAASWASGLFLLAGLFIGIWKFRAMVHRPNHQAPYYVDVAHRAAFMYSFASLVLSHLATHSVLSSGLALGWRDATENQFTERTFYTGIGTWLLVVGECGAVILLLVSFRPT